MKRSQINEIMAEADGFMRSFGFALPPFAYWSPEETKANVGRAKAMIDGRLGWDITDYGQGRFDELGLFFFHAAQRQVVRSASGWRHVLCREAVDFKARSDQPDAQPLPKG